MSMNKALPIGYSNFKNIITSNRLYIDKTEYLYDLITNNPKYTLLTRPRRFGKSLLISTLEQIFGGNKELFKNLWIYEKSSYSWDRFPVIHLDFSSIDNRSPELLEEELKNTLESIAIKYNIPLPRSSGLGFLLSQLITLISEQQGPVVLLIDEYDYPLTSHIKNDILMTANASVLRTFYTTLKSLNEHIHFMFMTGVSKYPQESMFSGLNNVSDISYLPEFAAIAGYTEEELDAYCTPYIQSIAQKQDTTPKAIRTKMRDWYNGYHFSISPVSVYNPFSVFNYLRTKSFKNYWFSSGTPTFLTNLIKEKKYTHTELNDVLKNPSSLEVFSQTRPTLDVLLYQTGYLTIKEAIPELDVYYLDYPNYEVRTSINQNLLCLLTDITPNTVSSFATKCILALNEENIADFMTTIQSLIASVPYDHHLEKEAYYHSLFNVIGNLLGLDIQSEVHTSNGRIDIVLTTKKAVFIIELKCNHPVKNALNQIKERRYYEKYLATNKNIFLIGLSFNHEKKLLLMEWVSEKI